MNWRITNKNASNLYVNAIDTNNPDITYSGFMQDYIPFGLGAIYNNGILERCGYWINGELQDKNTLSQEAYNNHMNKIFNNTSKGDMNPFEGMDE